MKGWVEGWRGGWVSGWKDRVVQSYQKQKSATGEAKDGQPCFNLAVCKLMAACPRKTERLQILI